MLAGLSYLTHHLAPATARLTLIAGLVGAVLSFLWGVRALRGRGGKALPILTLTSIGYVTLSQTVLGWGRGREEVPGQGTAAVVLTALFVLSMAMLLRIAYAGSCLT